MLVIKIFGVMFVLLLITVPISVVLGMLAFTPLFMNSGPAINTQFIIRQIVGGMESTPLLAIPMFILSGIIMARGGVSEKLFNVFSYFIGNKTGGMPCAVVITCLFYGAISGSAPATTAAVGTMTIPILLRLGYDLKFSAALVAISGGLGVIIPPSIPFIIYGMSSGSSVGALFLAGVLPGILIGFLLILYVYFYYKKHGEDKEKINAAISDLRQRGFFYVFKESFWALLSPIIILGSIYSGLVTPTEAALLSVIYAVFIALFVYKTITLEDIVPILVETVKTYAPILFILGTAAVFGRVLTLLQAPQEIAASIGGLLSNKVLFLIAINLFLIVVGMIMDTSPAILILTPIFMPLIQAAGINPIHFGVILIVNLAIGFVTPPVGINLYVASTLIKVPVLTIAKKAVPLMIVFFIALMLITFIPQISLMLVK